MLVWHGQSWCGNGHTCQRRSPPMRVCMYVCMYVCIDIKSLPHIAWRLQLRSESWGITNKLIMRVRYETLSSSHQCSWEKISHIFTGSTV